MAGNVGPSRFEASLNKSMRRNGGKLALLAVGLTFITLTAMSGDYLDSYAGVVVEIKSEDFNYRGRKNKGLRTVERFCLILRVDGESEPRVNCELKPAVIRGFKAGDRFKKPRFVNRPLLVASEGGPAAISPPPAPEDTGSPAAAAAAKP